MKMALTKEKQVDVSFDEVEWNVENEIQLFFAMNGHKPVGINKYFHMVCIWKKFCAATRKNVSLKLLWNHLGSMYDLVALDDVEDLPFPNQEVDFYLPETEFVTRSQRKEESEVKLKNQRDKHKEIKKERDLKESCKKDSIFCDIKGSKDMEKKREEIKTYVKDIEIKIDKYKDIKDTTKEFKSFKGRLKNKDNLEASNGKERKDPESSELVKRIPTRSTRQSTDNSSGTFSLSDTPPPKRRRI